MVDDKEIVDSGEIVDGEISTARYLGVVLPSYDPGGQR